MARDPEVQRFLTELFGEQSETEAPEPNASASIDQLSNDELDAQRQAVADEQARRQEQEETDVFLSALFRPKPGAVEFIREIHGCDGDAGSEG